MIQKIGAAMKKMASRAMMRGNRGAAQAVTEFGMEGMRSNLLTQPQNTITQHTGSTGVSKVFVDKVTSDAKAEINHSTNHNSTIQTNNKKLGGSIMDALQ